MKSNNVTKRRRAHFLEANDVFASLRMVKTSPQKVGLVTDLIRGLSAEVALAHLRFCRKKVANDIRKLLESAIANAENNRGFDIDKLYVKSVWVGKALIMKRWHARARGRGARIQKIFSNVYIVLSEV